MTTKLPGYVDDLARCGFLGGAAALAVLAALPGCGSSSGRDDSGLATRCPQRWDGSYCWHPAIADSSHDH